MIRAVGGSRQFLAAIEAEIKGLDGEIDTRVQELYGLTPDEIKSSNTVK